MLQRRAFTLIELLVVVAIIGVLLSILLPSLSAARNQAKLVKCQANLRSIGHGVQFYFGEYDDRFPNALFYGCLGYRGRSMMQALLGSQLPVDQRPMNGYFAVERDPLDEQDQAGRTQNPPFACPSDRGDAHRYSVPPYNLPGTFFIEHGASYSYASDSEDVPQLPYPVPTFGVQSCRKLRLSQIRYPHRKIVFEEPVFVPVYDLSDGRANWHDKKRAHGNVLFTDGHVDFLHPRITEMYAIPDENETYY